MEKEKKGIWITQKLIDNPELDWENKVLLSEIQSLHKLPDGCYVSNNKLSIFLGISRSAIIRRLNFLVENGYITTTNIYKNNKCVGRIIVPTEKVVVAVATGVVAKRTKVSRHCDNLVVAVATGVVAERYPINTLTNSVNNNSVKNSLSTNTEKINYFGIEFSEDELQEELSYRTIKENKIEKQDIIKITQYEELI